MSNSVKRLLLLLFVALVALVFIRGLSVYADQQTGAAHQTGTVRAADQFIPGAKITARQGEAKVIAYTDENGRYNLNLAPGVWDVDVEMLGFTTAHGQITVGEHAGAVATPDSNANHDWTLEMPRYGPAGSNASLADVPKPAAAGARTRQPGQGRGRGGFGTRPNATG